MIRLIAMSALALVIVIGALMLCTSDNRAAPTEVNAMRHPPADGRSAAEEPETRGTRLHSQQRRSNP